MTRKEFYLRAVIETYSALLRNSGVSIPKGDTPETDNALDSIDHLQEMAMLLASGLADDVEEYSWRFNVVDEDESPFE